MYRCDFLCKVNKYRCISLSMLQSCWIFGHRYDWIALLDVDELIVPRKHNSWVDMMKQVGLVVVVNLQFSSLFYFFSFSSLILLDLFCGDFGGVPIIMTNKEMSNAPSNQSLAKMVADITQIPNITAIPITQQNFQKSFLCSKQFF